MGADDAKDQADMAAEVDREEEANGEERGDAEGGGKKKKNYRKKGGDEDAPDGDAAGGRARVAGCRAGRRCAASVCMPVPLVETAPAGSAAPAPWDSRHSDGACVVRTCLQHPSRGDDMRKRRRAASPSPPRGGEGARAMPCAL